MLIKRYLRREIFHTSLSVILVILLIAISNKVVRLVGKAASGEVAPDVLIQVIFFQIPELLAFLLPVGLFLAILLSFSRLFADNEIPVMLACGISWQKLLSVAFNAGIVIMLIAAGLTCYFNPKLAEYRERLLREEGPMLLVQTISAGRFHSIQQDSLVFYVADISSDRRELKHIFIADQPKGTLTEQSGGSVLTAKTGSIITDAKMGMTYLNLNEGQRFYGTPGEKDYSILKFEGYQRLLEEMISPNGLYHRTMPTEMLWQTPSNSNLAELEWRLSIPLAAPLLALLALPLSQTSPRAGRFSRIFVALLICIFYFNLLTISKRWVATGILPPQIGVWWVHLLLLISALLMVVKASGRWHQGYHYLKKVIWPRYG